MSTTILPVGNGRQIRFRVDHDVIHLGREYRHPERGWMPDRSVVLRLAEVRSVAAVLQRLAGEIEQGLAP